MFGLMCFARFLRNTITNKKNDKENNILLSIIMFADSVVVVAVALVCLPILTNKD